jgi:hypothetical protein
MSNNPAIVIGVSAVNTADAELKKLDDKIRESTGIVQTEGNKMASSTSSTSDKVSNATSAMSEKVRQNYLRIAQAAAGLGAGIVGFATSFSTLEKAQTRSDQAQLTYERSLSRLNQMIAEGGHSADELAQQQEKVRINSEKAKQAQDDLNDTYTNFFANIPSQMIGFGVAAQSIYAMLGTTQKTSSATTAASAITYNGALASMNVANQTTAISTMTLGNVMRTVFLSNPITLPLIAVSAVVMALAFNVGGLRDRMNELGKAIGDAPPFLRPLLEALGGLQKLFGDNADEAKKLETANYAVGDSIAYEKSKVQSLNEYLDDQNEKLAETYHNNLLYVQSTGAIKDALALSNDELNLAAQYLRKQADEAEHTKEENFNLVASHMGLEKALSLNDTRLQQYANALRVAKETSDNLKPSIDATSDALDKQKSKIDTVKTALEALAEAQNRQVVTQFGMQVGLGGTVSTDALVAAGFGNNSSLMQSAASGRLGGVFTPAGRVLDTGGQLYEDVIGIGKETGTPHLLHKNEFIVPPSKMNTFSGSGRSTRDLPPVPSRSNNTRQPVTIQLVLDSRVIAEATFDDLERMRHKQNRHWVRCKDHGYLH